MFHTQMKVISGHRVSLGYSITCGKKRRNAAKTKQIHQYGTGNCFVKTGPFLYALLISCNPNLWSTTYYKSMIKVKNSGLGFQKRNHNYLINVKNSGLALQNWRSQCLYQHHEVRARAAGLWCGFHVNLFNVKYWAQTTELASIFLDTSHRPKKISV